MGGTIRRSGAPASSGPSARTRPFRKSCRRHTSTVFPTTISSPPTPSPARSGGGTEKRPEGHRPWIVESERREDAGREQHHSAARRKPGRPQDAGRRPKRALEGGTGVKSPPSRLT